MKLKGIIFDVDGTIADTEEIHRQAFNQAFSDFNLNWHWSKSKDEVSGKEAESHNFTRMRFNENGMVQGYWSLSEEELVLRQTGWTITR